MGGPTQARMEAISLTGNPAQLQDLYAVKEVFALPSLHPNLAPAAPVPQFKRFTVNAVPQNYSLLSKSRILMGLIINPFKLIDPNHDIVPCLGSTTRQDPGQPLQSAPQIVRCRRCRAYINPYIQFVEQGNWRCNMCYLVNELPGYYDYDQETGQQQDRYARAEM